MANAILNESEVDEAIAAFAGKLRGFFRRRVSDVALAEDLTQETLLKVYRSRDKLPEALRFEAWLYRIARNTLVDHYRRRRPATELPETLAVEPPDEVDEFRRAVQASLRRFLETLPESYREPLRLAEWEGLPLAKIALRLDLSLSAVKARVRRGRAMLKRKLQDCCRIEFDRMGKAIGWEPRRSCQC